MPTSVHYVLEIVAAEIGCQKIRERYATGKKNGNRSLRCFGQTASPNARSRLSFMIESLFNFNETAVVCFDSFISLSCNQYLTRSTPPNTLFLSFA